MSRKKITEIFEDRVVAEIYEKIRETDGVRFYDTEIYRKYYDANREERRSPSYQKRDLSSIHVLLVRADRYISDKLWRNKNNPGGPRDVGDSEDYAVEE